MATKPRTQNVPMALVGIGIVGFSLGAMSQSLWAIGVVIGLVLYVNGKVWR